jgi:hypothetical protein
MNDEQALYSMALSTFHRHGIASMPESPQFAVVVKQDCPTCRLIEPVLETLAAGGNTRIVCQDDPAFPAGVAGVRDDTDLAYSYHHDIETVPTLLRLGNGQEAERSVGWDRDAWRRLTGIRDLGDALTPFQPGCGSLSVAPGMAERLALRHGGLTLASRRIEFDAAEDPAEAMYERGWSDGLPLIAPTDLRIARMLAGTPRAADEVVGLIPPNLVECSVEKVAINAVMAGCRPEYLPVVLAALEAALDPLFNMHGLLCTTGFAGPVVIVNGPVARRIGMNARGNCFGQGNRANSTIGRALQLVIRNVGGGRPGEIDRSVFGHPGKVGFCFAEDESDTDWMPLNVARGSSPGSSTVTLFQGDGVHGIRAHRARDAGELTRSLAMGLRSACHPKLSGWSNAILAISPDHYRMYRREGWGRAEIEAGLLQALKQPGHELVEGAGGVAEGIDPARADELVDKFNEGGLLVVRAGGDGSLVSAMIAGWSAQRRPHEVRTITREIST